MDFELDLRSALLKIRALRLEWFQGRRDPRALRVALKFAILVDDFFALKQLSLEEETGLNSMAVYFFEEAKKREG